MEVTDFEPSGGLHLVPKRTITLTKLLPFFVYFDLVPKRSLKVPNPTMLVPNRLKSGECLIVWTPVKLFDSKRKI